MSFNIEVLPVPAPPSEINILVYQDTIIFYT
jgi:hypothetical protein